MGVSLPTRRRKSLYIDGCSALYLCVCVCLQLWEEDGLDLALIPYGCVATGPDSGFIEVIKNARTIAEVC